MEVNTDRVSSPDSASVKLPYTFKGQHDMTGVVIDSYHAKDTNFYYQEVFVVASLYKKIY
jgi:hypothetical protein